MPLPNDDQLDSEWLINQVAHALRNPIFAAQMQVQALILAGGASPSLTRPARVLDDQLTRLGQMIDEMLLYGRPVTLAISEIPTDSLIREAVAAATAVEDFGETTTRTNIDEAAQTVTCDRKAMAIALERILVNALQYSEAPHVIAIRVETDGSQTAIEIHDQGTGMSGELLENAKAPFYPQHRGRPGLGLAIASKMVEAHGGSVTLTSELERGTTVRCVVPPALPAQSLSQ